MISARHLARHEAWCFFPRTVERLHELGKVERIGECLVWDPLRRNIENGYGRVGPGERLAHCIAFELAGGVLPNRQVVLHSCDNKGCIEPRHLRAGTQSENIREAFERGLLFKTYTTERRREAQLKRRA